MEKKPSFGTLGTGQRFTPKKRTVPMSCFESGIDHIVYQLYGLTDEEIRIVEGKMNRIILAMEIFKN